MSQELPEGSGYFPRFLVHKMGFSFSWIACFKVLAGFLWAPWGFLWPFCKCLVNMGFSLTWIACLKILANSCFFLGLLLGILLLPVSSLCFFWPSLNCSDSLTWASVSLGLLVWKFWPTFCRFSGVPGSFPGFPGTSWGFLGLLLAFPSIVLTA
jgi:hypothetical protein